eukprot:gene11527-17749_t
MEPADETNVHMLLQALNTQLGSESRTSTAVKETGSLMDAAVAQSKENVRDRELDQFYNNNPAEQVDANDESAGHSIFDARSYPIARDEERVQVAHQESNNAGGASDVNLSALPSLSSLVRSRENSPSLTFASQKPNGPADWLLSCLNNQQHQAQQPQNNIGRGPTAGQSLLQIAMNQQQQNRLQQQQQQQQGFSLPAPSARLSPPLGNTGVLQSRMQLQQHQSAQLSETQMLKQRIVFLEQENSELKKQLARTYAINTPPPQAQHQQQEVRTPVGNGIGCRTPTPTTPTALNGLNSLNATAPSFIPITNSIQRHAASPVGFTGLRPGSGGHMQGMAGGNGPNGTGLANGNLSTPTSASSLSHALGSLGSMGSIHIANSQVASNGSLLNGTQNTMSSTPTNSPGPKSAVNNVCRHWVCK